MTKKNKKTKLGQGLLKGLKEVSGPKILLLDIETAPMLGYVWGLWDQNIGLNMVKSDWHVLSWSAKWLDSKKIMYMDQSKAKNIEDDKRILKVMWKLIDEADIIITQNGKSFDHKKLNARFVTHGMLPPSPYKIVDTLLIAKKHFAFTSNKLEYMSELLNEKYKKMTSKGRKFVGFDLWKECLAGNKSAWAEMKKYNSYDVLALEELYKKLIPWEPRINYNLYNDAVTHNCNVCNSVNLIRNGYQMTTAGKFPRFKCMDCGTHLSSKDNVFSKEKKKSLKKGSFNS